MDEKLQFNFNQFKSLMNDKWDDSKILEQANIIAVKDKAIRKGENVLHIEYLGGLLSDEDLIEFEVELKKIGIELSLHDKKGVQYGSLEELSGVVTGILSSDITNNILTGVVGNAVWSGLCKVWVLIYKKLKGKQITTITEGGHSKLKEATMSIVLYLNPVASIEYNLKGDFDNEAEALETFIKILENAKSLLVNKLPSESFVAEANFESKLVEIIDVEKFFRDKMEKQKENEKKIKLKKSANKKRKK